MSESPFIVTAASHLRPFIPSCLYGMFLLNVVFHSLTLH
jgi:hypothetical protein